ncbi:MAG: type II toxin-antitoxin system Phd/YefM family antitoxin [Cyanobacteria bacterium SW_4_48_29]|jgi:prevent-host-death family protein|nr:MAG: type II toxin-antitoxin system Phd/YefM family antitoxin [Cyanobacteria bacterium SW_4_48_29]
MTSKYSIAEARDHFSEIVRSVETGEPVKLTRHGKTVVVMVSEQEFERLKGQQKNFWEALRRYRQEVDLNFDSNPLEEVRTQSVGRSVSL